MANKMNPELIKQAVTMLLEGIGEDPNRAGLVETPDRIARMYEEILAGMSQDPAELFATTFDEGHQEMVIVHDIPVYSICEHHLVPFYGVAHVAYIPTQSGRVCGISKLARLVDLYARRAQVQERLTSQVADALVEHMEPIGAMVVMECEHMCMTMRGVKKPGSKTTTSAVRGTFQSSDRTRAEAMRLITQGR